MTQAPSMAQTMLWAMLLVTLACWAYAIGMALYRVRGLILQREHEAAWVQNLLRAGGDRAGGAA
jgi:heme exporter protein C